MLYDEELVQIIHTLLVYAFIIKGYTHRLSHTVSSLYAMLEWLSWIFECARLFWFLGGGGGGGGGWIKILYSYYTSHWVNKQYNNY